MWPVDPWLWDLKVEGPSQRSRCWRPRPRRPPSRGLAALGLVGGPGLDEVGGHCRRIPKGSDTRGPSRSRRGVPPRSVAADREFSDPESSSPALPVRPSFTQPREDWALGPHVGVGSLGSGPGASGAGSGARRGCRKRRRLGAGWIGAGAGIRNGWGGREPAAE